MRRKLTDRFCANAKSATAQTDYFDEETRGLALRVAKGGRKTWTLHYTAGGKRVRMGLGTYPATSLAAARSAADLARGDVEAGADPRAGKRAPADTLKSVADEYLRREGARLRTADWREKALARLVYPTFGAKLIGDIKRSDIVRLLDRIEDERGQVMADRTLAIVRRIMNWHASRSDEFRSPIVRGMARANGRGRDRILTDEELRKVWVAADGAGPFGAFVQFLLLTATRRNEAAKAQRSEIVGTDWTIPAARYKTGTDHLIPLSQAAQAIIGVQGAEQGFPAPVTECDFIFTLDGKRALGGYHLPKVALDEASGVIGWTLHDLRRTARSLMSRAGVPADHAERCLGHVIGGVRGVYDRFAYREEKARAFEALARVVASIVDPQANVVPMVRR